MGSMRDYETAAWRVDLMVDEREAKKAMRRAESMG
jgi:hypothetical protein